jgi:hypothetical protein
LRLTHQASSAITHCEGYGHSPIDDGSDGGALINNDRDPTQSAIFEVFDWSTHID